MLASSHGLDASALLLVAAFAEAANLRGTPRSRQAVKMTDVPSREAICFVITLGQQRVFKYGALAVEDAGLQPSTVGVRKLRWFIEEGAVFLKHEIGIHFGLKFQVAHVRLAVNIADALAEFKGGMDGVIEFFEEHHEGEDVLVVQATGRIVSFQRLDNTRSEEHTSELQSQSNL